MKKKLKAKKTISVYLPISLAENLFSFLEEEELGVSPFINSLIVKRLKKYNKTTKVYVDDTQSE